nr:DUF4194 domain-containing protein [uncultured Desulfobacter sp.]
MREKKFKHNTSESTDTFDFIDKMRIQNTPPDQDLGLSGLSQGEEASTGRAASPPLPASGGITVPRELEKESNEPHGIMPSEARRALVFLLRQGVILSSQKSKLFEAICRYETPVRRHLSQVYLKLVLDEKSGVAFVAGMQNEHGEVLEGDEDQAEMEQSSLITRRTLPLYDTLLLLVLRKHYQNRETCGEQKIVIDKEKIESDLSPFLPLSNSARTDRQKLNGALKKMVGHKILNTVRGSEDRFEITPVIRYVVSAQFLESMLKEYTRLANELDKEK